jgi:hypothetical protein
MGCIHQQNKDLEKAMEVWMEVYMTAKKIGEHKILENLKGLAQELGGKGLEFWEDLAGKRG